VSTPRGRARSSGPRSGLDAVVGSEAYETTAADEEQARTVGLLLLGKGAVLAHGFDRPLAVEMDEDEQSGRRTRRYRDP